MRKNLKKELKLKDGSVYGKGETFEVFVKEEAPGIAVLVHPYSNREIKIKSVSLHKYFPGFVKPAEELSDPDFDSCIVPSLTGRNVEPDGWDEKGFPSILLAMGMI